MAQIRTRRGKKGVTYQATVRMTGHPAAIRTFDSKGAARTWAAEVEAAIRDRRYNSPKLALITLADALDRYDKTITSTKAATTQLRERGCIKNLLLYLGADTLLPDIGPAVVARFRDDRLRQVSAYSVRLELALLSHLFRKARQEWELPVSNPVEAIERPAAPQGRARFLNEDEIGRLLEQCRASKNQRLYAFVLVLLHTGMRPSEVAGLRCRQIDAPGRAILLELTKNRDRRRIPLTEAAIEALRPWLVDRRPDDHIMISERAAAGQGAARPSNVFRTAFDAARVRAGLPWCHMHDLRHTAASYMLMRGTDMRTLAAILGHRTMQMVMRYTHLLDEHQRAAVDRIGDLGIDQTKTG